MTTGLVPLLSRLSQKRFMSRLLQDPTVYHTLLFTAVRGVDHAPRQGCKELDRHMQLICRVMLVLILCGISGFFLFLFYSITTIYSVILHRIPA